MAFNKDDADVYIGYGNIFIIHTHTQEKHLKDVHQNIDSGLLREWFSLSVTVKS